jgi:signal transduction histidine kinase
MTEASDLVLPPGKYVAVTIAVQGEGVSPENLKKIFDPYFTTSRKAQGWDWPPPMPSSASTAAASR